MTSDRQDVLDFVDRYLDAYHREDWDDIRDCLTDDIVAADAGVGIRLEGADEVIDGHKATAARFPGRHYEIERIVVDGDFLAIWGLWLGDLADGMSGPSAHWHSAQSDQVGPFKFCRVARLEDGKFKHYTDYTVNASLSTWQGPSA